MVISKLRMQAHLSAIMKQETITSMPLSPLDFRKFLLFDR